MTNFPENIMTVLSILGVVSPVGFGFAIYKLSRIFITIDRHVMDLKFASDRFEEYRRFAEEERTELKRRIYDLEKLYMRRDRDE